MAQLIGKRFESPDEVREFTEGTGRVELVDLNGHAVGRGTFEPGWRWSQNVKPIGARAHARSTTSATCSRAGWH